ncbi:hypothetical protein [Paractinoplanes brasiliensis]|uniref:Uncharacterized protein n=1 Tax=Paractinoplanes brasiliensis TaxID=52695 RepID=A0A4R6K0N3_9ACTN|nr:hypothetical protein [Actinoplanes brasiliensis]TDO41136.1 hypothetical protein C8E87_4865 [Actinoplanes brasiliensis]GID26206.1 hypothetical protein Abr02nite_11890 [Actinoplanes brasiliensis]
MNNVLEQSETGREIARRNRHRGFVEGLSQGLVQAFAQSFAEAFARNSVATFEESFVQGRIDGMRTLLRVKYGVIDDLDDLAKRLSDADYDGNFARIIAGATLAELRS